MNSFHLISATHIRYRRPLWPNYLLGVARRFLDRGYQLKNIHCVVGGDVPTGAGLSSSAALECGFAFALDQLHFFNTPKLELIYMAQWAEHNYVGVKCGIMDQFSSMMGAEGQRLCARLPLLILPLFSRGPEGLLYCTLRYNGQTLFGGFCLQ